METRPARRQRPPSGTGCASPCDGRPHAEGVQRPDWSQVIAQVSKGDALAFAELSRLVTRILGRLRAYDFRDEWPDLVQDVVLATLVAHREGRIQDPAAVVGYVHQTTRFKFLGRLRSSHRRRERQTGSLEDAEIPAPLGDDAPLPAWDVRCIDVRRALERIPEPQRSLVVAVYGHKLTYQQAANHLGIPLGSAKRYLAQGLKELRHQLGGEEA